MKAELTLSEKTTAMEKCIKMAKELHQPSGRIENLQFGQQPMNTCVTPAQIAETAKDIFDWLTS